MARRKNAKKQKKTLGNYIFLIIGAVIVVVVAVSWFAFPDWHAQPGGFWTLISAAAVGVVGIVKDVVSIIKDAREIENTPANKGQTSVKSEPHGVNISSFFQLGKKNKLGVNQRDVTVKGAAEVGSGNQITIGSTAPKRRKRR